ncbi:MAG: CarD family transcriptional regulator [Lachnospiraceae bacterium]|nr:CarD family transcriptional regulator [Lachnospiraceae bacterium]
MRWKQGDTVVHSRDGICAVIDIQEMSLAGEPKNYYILEPVYEQGSKLYIPIEKEALFLRAPVTEEEIITYIRNLPDMDIAWISDEKKRQAMIADARKTASSETLLGLVSVFYKKRSERHREGRKFHSSDEQFLKDIETRINREFAYVLGIEPDEVQGFIERQLKAG